MNYQAVLAITNAEDALEVAEILKAVKEMEKVKIIAITPRMESRSAVNPGQAKSITEKPS